MIRPVPTAKVDKYLCFPFGEFKSYLAGFSIPQKAHISRFQNVHRQQNHTDKRVNICSFKYILVQVWAIICSYYRWTNICCVIPLEWEQNAFLCHHPMSYFAMLRFVYYFNWVHWWQKVHNLRPNTRLQETKPRQCFIFFKCCCSRLTLNY